MSQPMPARHALLALLVALTTLTACSGESAESCVDDSDCFKGEVCDQDREECIVTVGGSGSGGSSSGETGGSTSGGTTSGGTTTSGGGSGSAGTTSSGSTSGSTSGGNSGGTSGGSAGGTTGGDSCVLGKFDTCTDDDPYQPGDASERYQIVARKEVQFLEPATLEDKDDEAAFIDRVDAVGCWWQNGHNDELDEGYSISNGDVFVGATEPSSFQGAVCPGDSDKYRLRLYRCPAFSYDIYIRARITSCQPHRDAASLEIVPASDDVNDTCSELRETYKGRFYCWEVGPQEIDGVTWKTWRIRVPKRNSDYPTSVGLAIGADAETNVPFDYEFQVEVVRP